MVIIIQVVAETKDSVVMCTYEWSPESLPHVRVVSRQITTGQEGYNDSVGPFQLIKVGVRVIKQGIDHGWNIILWW